MLINNAMSAVLQNKADKISLQRTKEQNKLLNTFGI
jgi:hypothetical protein